MIYKEYIGSCPKCSDGIVLQKYGKYGLYLVCDLNCGLTFSNKIGISKEDLIKMLNLEKTKIYTVTKQKNNGVTKYNARYYLDKNNFKVIVEFVDGKY